MAASPLLGKIIQWIKLKASHLQMEKKL